MRLTSTSLMAIAALAASGMSAEIVHPNARKAPMMVSRPRPRVQRMVVSASAEITEWNAAVDARKAAKKARK
jgi:hypothetical protein